MSKLFWRPIPIAIRVCAVLSVLVFGSIGARAQELGPNDPLERVQLASLRYPDKILRGRSISVDYFVPGPGSFVLSDDNWLDLDYAPSDLLAGNSVMTVLWNGVPILDRLLGDTPGPMHVSTRIPRERIDPDLNRLQIQGLLSVDRETCEDDVPGRWLTIFSSSALRYGVAERQVLPRPIRADLAEYPAPLFVPNVPRSAPIRFVLPSQPTSSELTAAVRIAAYLGQAVARSGGQPPLLEMVRDDGFTPERVEDGHLIFVGASRSLASVRRLPETALRRVPDGGYADASGAPVGPGTGIIYEVPSPWNASRAALVVTGADDAAVQRAATTLAGSAGIGTLRGDSALITRLDPGEDAALPASTTIRLSDLGREDATVTGVGDHAISFVVEVPSSPGRAGLPFELVTSHSSLLDRARSSLRVVLNGTPLTSSTFKEIGTPRGTLRVELPSASLRAGANTVAIELSLRLPEIAADGQRCAAYPDEQAWAVLHAESNIQPPTSGVATVEVPTLANYPFPFVRRGALDHALLVVPDDVNTGSAMIRLAADLGRGSRVEALLPRAVKASEFQAFIAGSPEWDVILLGVPEQIPALGELGGRMPIQVANGERIVLSAELALSVRDASELGVLQQIGSPWAHGRTVLIVSATSIEALPLAGEALRQGNLGGNAALVSRAEPTPPMPGRVGSPEPLVLGGQPRETLRVTTYRLRPAIEADTDQAERRPPYVLLSAAMASAALGLMALGLAYQAFGVPVRFRRRK